MKKEVFSIIGLFLVTLTAFGQISSLPYSQSFDGDFTTGSPAEFIPNWTGNEVAATNRIFRETTNFNSAPAAMAIVPTGSFNGEIVVDFNLVNYSDITLSFVAKSMLNGDGTRPTKLEIATSTDGGSTWTGEEEIGEFPNEDQANFTPFTYDLPASANQVPSVKVRFSVTTGTGGSGTRAKLIIDNVIFDGDETNSTNPILTVNPATLEFSQTLGAPSATQSVSVYGANLTDDITLTVTTPFEVALTEEGTYATTQSLSLTDGGFSGSVYIRLNATEVNTFTEILTAQTTGITQDIEITLNGEATASQVTNPAPFDLSTGNYSFTEWNADSATGTYPDNMIFWTHATTDPSINTEFVEDYTCLYNLTNRSRIAGENENGVSFVNTGNSQYVGVCDGSDPTQSSGDTIINGRTGAAVLALNTLNRENIQIEWTGRTIVRNFRLYALKLQYRIGNGGGNPNVGWINTDSEYLANDTENHSEAFTVTLPENAENQDVVQLRWVYFQHESNDASGARAHLALDDITVSSDETASVSGFEKNTFRMYPNPATSMVNFNKEVTATVFDITGKKVLSFENTTSVNISQLNKGVYFVKTNEGVTNKLIVK